MEFKIDTNDNYVVLTPISPQFDEKLTGAVGEKWTELVEQGSSNLIINLENCATATLSVMAEIIQLHEKFYNAEQSLVFTNLQPDVKVVLQKHEAYHDINFAPTMIEAIDIISMEALQRDLMSEEGDIDDL